MGTESPEVQMARLDEKLKSILNELESARNGRKQQYDSIEKLGRSLTSIEGRVENVENSLAVTKPTIDEFVIIKHKVIGAGIMGRWLWAIVGGLLTFIFSMREALVTWLSK